MKPLRFWIIKQGTARARVKAADYFAARDRAYLMGFKSPDSIVLDEVSK